MDDIRLLTEQEFRSCFAEPMRNVTAEAEAVVDVWPYVDEIDLDEIQIPHVNDVHYVYRDAQSRFDHILIGTGRYNTLLVIVVDLASKRIVGHHALDLNRQYGVKGGHLKEAP